MLPSVVKILFVIEVSSYWVDVLFLDHLHVAVVDLGVAVTPLVQVAEVSLLGKAWLQGEVSHLEEASSFQGVASFLVEAFQGEGACQALVSVMLLGIVQLK